MIDLDETLSDVVENIGITGDIRAWEDFITDGQTLAF